MNKNTEQSAHLQTNKQAARGSEGFDTCQTKQKQTKIEKGLSHTIKTPSK